MIPRYSGVAQWLHWIIAVLIVTQFALGWSGTNLPLGLHKLAILARHKSFGMTVLMLAIVRLLWRFANPPPPLPAELSPRERRLAQVVHAALYALLFAMPISGWLMSSAKSYSVSWFGLFTWPNLIPANETTFQALKATHDFLSLLLLALALLHVLAALWHYFILKDHVLSRMLPFSRLERRS